MSHKSSFPNAPVGSLPPLSTLYLHFLVLTTLNSPVGVVCTLALGCLFLFFVGESGCLCNPGVCFLFLPGLLFSGSTLLRSSTSTKPNSSPYQWAMAKVWAQTLLFQYPLQSHLAITLLGLGLGFAITPDHVLEVGLGKLTILTEHTDHVQSIHLLHIVHHLVVLELWGWLVALAMVPAIQQV